MRKLQNLNEVELRTVCHELARTIESYFTGVSLEKPMFVTLLFNDPKIAQYVCNCRRQDVIKAMRECATRLERNEDIKR